MLSLPIFQLLSPPSFCFANLDAPQQARDGPCRRRMGDVCRILAETRPVPNVADLSGGWENIPNPEQVADHQGYESGQLLGCLCPLQDQEGD